MDWEAGNLLEAWKSFRQQVELVFDCPLVEKDEEVKIKYLLIWAGEKGRDIFNTWILSQVDSKKLSKHYEKFQEYVQPKQNPEFSRYKFNNEIQGSRPMAKYCS